MAVQASVMKNTIGYLEWKKDSSTHSWPAWCKSKILVRLTPGFALVFDQCVPIRFELGRGDCFKSHCIQGGPRVWAPIRCCIPLSFLVDQMPSISQGSLLLSATLLSDGLQGNSVSRAEGRTSRSGRGCDSPVHASCSRGEVLAV